MFSFATFFKVRSNTVSYLGNISRKEEFNTVTESVLKTTLVEISDLRNRKLKDVIIPEISKKPEKIFCYNLHKVYTYVFLIFC